MDFAPIFKQHAGRVIARLVRLCGSLEAAEDAFQDACLEALQRWPDGGVPLEPGAWLTTVARNRGLDRARRAARHPLISVEDSEAPALLAQLEERVDSGLADDQLRLFFTCCHPALSPAAQVALTLRTWAGSPPRRSPAPSTSPRPPPPSG